MPKRFTATEKWTDPWFCGLTTSHKLAWFYLCENCDVAGVIDLNKELADFLLRDTLDWNAFIEAAGEKRIVKLPCGKLWLAGFVTFQYGELSESCPPHRSIFKILGKYSLTERVVKGLAKGSHTLQEKEKEKEKDKERVKKGDARGKQRRVEASDVPVPDGWNTVDVLQAIRDWLAYKAARGEPYKDGAYLGRKVAEFTTLGREAFVAAVNSSIGSNYAGLYPAKDLHDGNKKRITSGQVFDPKSDNGTVHGW